MSSVSLCENDIPGSSLDVNKYSISPKMPRSGAQSQVLRTYSHLVLGYYVQISTQILIHLVGVTRP